MLDPIRSNIALLIRKKGISIAELERLAGLKNGAVRNIIQGKSKNPTIQTLIKICKILDCSLNAIINTNNFEHTVHNISFTKNQEIENWDRELFTKSTEFVGEYLYQNKINIKFYEAISLIIEVYSFAIIKNEGVIDKKMSEWILEKLLKSLI